MSTSPYPGLRPFHRDEADIFFGRDEQVDQLLIRLGKSRFLAVVGPSGCGKSSLVHTGLLNALEAGFLADVGLHWRIATMQPGSHPMRNLAAALLEHIGPDRCPSLLSGEGRGEGFQKDTNSNPVIESQITSFSNTGTSTANETPQHDDTAFLLATLRRGPLGLIEVLREQPLPENTNLLLVVYQFEEIFRYREHQDRDEADAFVALLLRSVMDNTFPVYIVITMRSDFLGDCALFPGLPEALNDSQFLTPRLTREQRRLAITGPARVCGGDVEPALVNRLLNDMGADPDQLPVLQHALMRLWTDAVKRDNKPVILKLDDYETLGGWDNTLSNHADEAFTELDEKQQTIAEIMFRALTERSGARRDTRRPVSLQTVADIAGVGIEQVIPVIETFRHVDRSFVMPPEGQPLTAETLIDISHESLIRQWRRMKEWVEQEAKSAETYRRLEQSALLHDEKRAELLQGLDLYSVLEWKKLEKPAPAWAVRYGGAFDQAMRFLAASERRHTLKSILKLFVVGVVFITAAYMTWLWQQAETERSKATGARLQAEAQLLLSQDPSKQSNILLGIEALKHNPHDSAALNQFLLASLNMLPKPGHALQHDNSVCKVVFSSDGKQLATVSRDRSDDENDDECFGHRVSLWDVATGQELQRLHYDNEIYDVMYSPDSKQLATASSDGTARLWDTSSGRELNRLHHNSSVFDVVFSPDGKRLATSSRDKMARLWDTATGLERQRFSHNSFVSDVTFSPDGKQLATASSDKTARLWDTVTGKELQRLHDDSEFNTITFSPNGKQLATAMPDGSARLWDAATGQELQRLNHDGHVNTVTFSPEGKQLATASEDKTARLWDVATGKELQRLNHNGIVFTVTFSPDGKQLVTASEDNTGRVWDVDTGQELHRLNHDSEVYDVTFSSDGKQLATASKDETARLWDVTSMEPRQLRLDGPIKDAVFSADGSRLAVTSYNNTAALWEVITGKELQHLHLDDMFYQLTLSSDGKQLAAIGSRDMTVRLWDMETGQELHRLHHDHPVRAAIFSSNGKLLATLTEDGTAWLWGTSTGRELQHLRQNTDIIDATFSPDGKQLTAVSPDYMAIWDVASGREVQHLSQDDPIRSAIFGPDGRQLAVIMAVKPVVLLWDVTSARELWHLNHDRLVATVTFSTDGKRVVTVSDDNAVRIWDTATGKEILRLNHDNPVNAVSFSPDGKQLATASVDKTARMWDTATGKEILRLNHDEAVQTMTFSPDGKWLVTGSDDKTVRLWLWQPEDIMKELCSRLIHNMSWDDWQNYFEDEPYRKTCENLPIDPTYPETGKQLVREGKMAEATRMIQQLNAAEPALKLDRERTLQKWTAPIRFKEAEQLLQKQKIIEAIAAFNQADKMDQQLISAESWNSLCWKGSLAGYPSQVLDVCEKAVRTATAEQRWQYQDSRGLVRALTGNSQGAIEDFEVFIQKTSNEQHKKQRQAWVQALRAGLNPFTKEELATLQNQ